MRVFDVQDIINALMRLQDESVNNLHDDSIKVLEGNLRGVIAFLDDIGILSTQEYFEVLELSFNSSYSSKHQRYIDTRQLLVGILESKKGE